MPDICGARSPVACGSGSFLRQTELSCQQSYFGKSSAGLGLSLAGSRASLGCSAFPPGQAVLGAGGESAAITRCCLPAMGYSTPAAARRVQGWGWGGSLRGAFTLAPFPGLGEDAGSNQHSRWVLALAIPESTSLVSVCFQG